MIDAMTCTDSLDRFVKAAGHKGNVLWSHKLDGVRTLAVVYGDETVKYFSRAKKEFPNFNIFDPHLIELANRAVALKLARYPVIFDGEVVAENFSNVMTQLRRIKDIDQSIFRFHIFDFPIDNVPLARRLDALRHIFNGDRYERVKALPHNAVDLELGESVHALMDSAVKEGFEGVVLKTKDGFYEHKRSAHWCKLKPVETVDCPVIGLEPGQGKYEGMLGALVVDLDGVKVSVGGGYTDEQRAEFFARPPAMIEMRFQERLKSGSVRFPVFVRVREDK